MIKGKTALKILLPVVILLVGFFVMSTLVKSRPAPKKSVPREEGVLVEVMIAKRQDYRVLVKSTGTVTPARTVAISPQVSGRIVSVAPGLANGLFVKEGELLFEIESIDYELALKRAEAARVKAEYELITVESGAEVARLEWERLKNKGSVEPNPLVLYAPQLRNARAALDSADAVVEQAIVNIERTRVAAPFNGRIKSESIEIGQLVTTGAAIMEISGTEKAEIDVPLTAYDISWIETPKSPASKNFSKTILRTSMGGSREGRVLRSSGEVNARDRMMQVVVGLEDPYGLEEESTGLVSLPEGAFVDVEIEGRLLKNIFRIPRTAVRDGSTIWTMDKEDKLRINKVTILLTDRETVVIKKGLAAGDKIITTNLSGAADGLKLRAVDKGKGKGTAL